MILLAFQSVLESLLQKTVNIISMRNSLPSYSSPELPSHNSTAANQLYEQTTRQSKILAQRNRMGTGASELLQGAPDNPTHYLDSLERFKKDYASYDRQLRDEEKTKRQQELDRRRFEQLDRDSRRWEAVEEYQNKLKNRQLENAQHLTMGIKRAANSNGLAYNPINLQYDRNQQGLKLKYQDQEQRIRTLVRAHNMDHYGNSKYNPLTGQTRLAVEQVVPPELNERFGNKLTMHYDNLRLKVPSSDNSRVTNQNRSLI